MMAVETFPGKIPAPSAGVDFSVSHFPPCNEFGRICGVHDSGLSVSDWMDVSHFSILTGYYLYSS